MTNRRSLFKALIGAAGVAAVAAKKANTLPLVSKPSVSAGNMTLAPDFTTSRMVELRNAEGQYLGKIPLL